MLGGAVPIEPRLSVVKEVDPGTASSHDLVVRGKTWYFRPQLCGNGGIDLQWHEYIRTEDMTGQFMMAAPVNGMYTFCRYSAHVYLSKFERALTWIGVSRAWLLRNKAKCAVADAKVKIAWHVAWEDRRLQLIKEIGV